MCAAALTCRLRTRGIQFLFCPEMLHYTDATRYVGILIHCQIPELLCVVQVILIFRFLLVLFCQHRVALQRPDKFRNRRIRMSSVQRIFIPGSHIFIKRRLVKLVSCFQMACIIRIVVQIIQTIVHSAVLCSQNTVLNRSCPLTDTVVYPCPKIFRRLQRLFISCITVCIHKSCQHLMHIVPRNPYITFRFSFQYVKLIFNIFLVIHLCAKQETGTKRILTLFQAGNNSIQLFFQFLVSRSPHALRARR